MADPAAPYRPRTHVGTTLLFDSPYFMAGEFEMQVKIDTFAASAERFNVSGQWRII